MAQLDVSVKMGKEAHELAEGLRKIVKAAKDATADGWQTGADLPVVATTALAELFKMVEGLDKLEDEWNEGKGAFLSGLVVPVLGMVDDLLPKSE